MALASIDVWFLWRERDGSIVRYAVVLSHEHHLISLFTSCCHYLWRHFVRFGNSFGPSDCCLFLAYPCFLPLPYLMPYLSCIKKCAPAKTGPYLVMSKEPSP
jgi:hypothetical protein